MAFHDIQCVRCNHGHLNIESQIIRCEHCGTSYQILHGVPILFPDAIVQSIHEKPSESFAASLIDAMSLPTNSETTAQIQKIFSETYRFGDFLLDAENQFLQRLKACGISIAESEKYDIQSFTFAPYTQTSLKQKVLKKIKRLFTAAESESTAETQAEEAPLRYRWVLDYLPRTMQAGIEFTGNVRIENIGTVVISSQEIDPVLSSYHWRTETGEMSVFDGCRTPFPIDLSAGQQLTLPLKIQTPDEPGKYILELTLLQEGKAWLDGDAKQIPIQVIAEPLPDHTANWKKTDQALSYTEDHDRSLELLKDRLAKTGKSRLKLLEIGGNVHPIIFHFEGDIYNLDVDIYGLQIGAMLNQHWQREVQFICADAHALPFADKTFDAIVLVSALHHFPDLVGFLRSLSRKLQPNGFIAALSEPVGHYYGANIAPELLRDLLSGVNEQTFTLPEYADIFRRAGLTADVVVDAGSLKAFLTPQQ
ncbi:methyltransferase domain-containing protein [Leptolyngbya sp. AN03gr2]|uniref:methyltransferase domain-containing protein n=1 Tax=unclassified Leptolyngbya TaxID=2650499 RepID=UPI003D31EDAA